MHYIIKPSKNLKGDVKIPGSKCQTARGLMFGTMAEGETHLINPMPGIDSYSIIDCCRSLGAKIDCRSDEEWIIQGAGIRNIKAPATVLDVGNSGTGLYMLTSLAACIEGASVISGDFQTNNRSVAPLLNAIREMGGKAISSRNNELAPLLIEGRVQGGHTVHFPGNNVQWIIGLLVCCGSLDGDTEIVVDNLGERPYAALTVDWARTAGVEVINNDFKSFYIRGNQEYKPFTKVVPSDWCSATYPMVAAAITEGSRIKLLDMDMNDFQGEKVYVDIINQMGGHVEVLDNGKGGVIVEGGHKLTGIEIDCKDMPDAIPALAVLGCYAEGKTVLNNIRACRLKETDRCKAIMEELTKMGGKFEETENSLTIYHSKLHGTTLNGHHDHRIVMASSIAALGAEGETLIDGAETVGVSFPRFFEEMTKIGADMTRLKEC